MIDVLVPDGSFCPMNHCTRNDDSFAAVPPLVVPSVVQKIGGPKVSPNANLLLGCYSGATMAVCSYSLPAFPSLVAFSYADGSVLWSSPLDDLTNSPSRTTEAILIARVASDGGRTRRMVFAANPNQIVAYLGSNGSAVWKRAMTSITPAAPNGFGVPTSLNVDDDKELVFATSEGWIVKLNPADGSTIDAYRMSTTVFVNGRRYVGTLDTVNSVAVIGNVLYSNAQFAGDASGPWPPSSLTPVFVVRVELSQPDKPGEEHQIRPISQPAGPADPTPDRVQVGTHSAGGSPPAW